MACPECGGSGVDDTAACDALFKDIVGREFSHAALFGVHRLTVDAYSLQHPAQYMKSTKSAAAHLAGMCWSLEYDAGPSASRVLSGWLDGAIELDRVEPPPPGRRGRLTVHHVHAATEAEHVARVQEWARDVWAAWEVGHDQARSWVESVVSYGRERAP